MPKHTREPRPAQIIKEATQLFSRDGYKKVTIKQLAQACGITEPALYRHFKSKQAIYDAVLDSLEAQLVSIKIFDELAETLEVEPLLRGLAEHIISYYKEHEEVYRLLLYSALEGHQKAKHVHGLIRGKYVRFLIDRFNQIHEAGRMMEKNNEITARCFVGMVFDCALGFTLWKGMQGKVYDPMHVINNNIPIYVQGLTKK